MKLRIWSGIVLVGGLLLALPGRVAWADDPPPSRSSGATSRSDEPVKSTARRDPSHRLPRNYSQLGLTPAQKDQIYAIRARFYGRIQELQQQLKEQQREMEMACEAVLTADQKKALGELRARSASAKSSKSSSRRSSKAPAPPATASPPSSKSPDRSGSAGSGRKS